MDLFAHHSIIPMTILGVNCLLRASSQITVPPVTGSMSQKLNQIDYVFPQENREKTMQSIARE